jgi:hypothetical protein
MLLIDIDTFSLKFGFIASVPWRYSSDRLRDWATAGVRVGSNRANFLSPDCFIGCRYKYIQAQRLNILKQPFRAVDRVPKTFARMNVLKPE